MAAQVDTPGNPRPILNSGYNEMQGQISRDGKWLAYTSDDTGTFQVYVMPLPAGTRIPVSVSGGLDPHWGASDNELFYINHKAHRLNVVSIKRMGKEIEIGPPQPLFEVRDAMTSPPFTSVYDVAPDGEHFLVRVTREDVRTTPLAVLLNWPVNRRP
jgi:Tol biopolymer transport system component